MVQPGGNQDKATHQCLAKYQAHASHHCLDKHQAQASHHFLVDHQDQVNHLYFIIKKILCVIIFHLLEESNDLLKAEVQGEAMEEALTEEVEEPLVEALEVYQVSNQINQGL